MQESTLNDSPIFICGHPKSGTSLLRALFDSHPQIVAYPEETVFFRRFLPQIQNKTAAEKLDLANQLLTHIFEWDAAAPPSHQAGYLDRTYTQFPASQVRARMRERLERGFRHDGDILSAVILAFGDVTGQTSDATRYWLEKTPYNEYFARQIFSWWPNARCIHVVRDPRDNFVSYRRKHPDWDAEIFAYNWFRSTRAGIKNDKHYGADRYLLLSYEVFTQEPEETLGKLRTFLNIEDDPALRVPMRAGYAWQGNSMFSDKFTGISTAAVGRWADILSPKDLAIIEHPNHILLKRFEYQLAANKKDIPSGLFWRMLKKKIYTLIQIISKNVPHKVLPGKESL